MQGKSFKDYLREVERERQFPVHIDLDLDIPQDRKNVFAFYHFESSDVLAEFIIRSLLTEDKPSVDLGKERSIIFHRAHVPNAEDHLHFLVKGAKIAAINRSGTAHDSSHGYKLQAWAMDGAAQHYPGFKLPKYGLIEALFAEQTGFLTESRQGSDVLLSVNTMMLAEQTAQTSENE